MWILYAVVARVLGIACVAAFIMGIVLNSKAKKNENADVNKVKAKKCFISAIALAVLAVACFLTTFIGSGNDTLDLEATANEAIAYYYNK